MAAMIEIDGAHGATKTRSPQSQLPNPNAPTAIERRIPKRTAKTPRVGL